MNKLRRNQFEGLTLFGIAVALVGLIPSQTTFGMLCLSVSAILLGVLAINQYKD